MKVPEAPKNVQHMTGATVALVIYVPIAHNSYTHTNKYIDLTHVYCTAVFVSETQILTAGHCMKGLATMQAKIKNMLTKSPTNESEDDDDDDDDSIPTANPVGLTVHYTLQNAVVGPGYEPTAIYMGKSVAIDTTHDLALISTVGNAVPEHDIAKVATELPAVGDTVYAVGNPSNFTYSLAKGIVSSYQNDLKKIGTSFEGPWILVGAPTVYYGSSGGPLYSSDGKLIGICSMLAGDIPATTIFVRTDTIRKFLNDQKTKKK
jgi:hypothetical protein